MNQKALPWMRTRAVTSMIAAGYVLVDYLAMFAMSLETWRLRHKTSMQLARVDTRVLRDAGISESQRFIAVNKSFWEK